MMLSQAFSQIFSNLYNILKIALEHFGREVTDFYKERRKVPSNQLRKETGDKKLKF